MASEALELLPIEDPKDTKKSEGKLNENEGTQH